MPLGGLEGEERWEYCDVILRELGLGAKVNRNDPELANLMDQLGGHPLAMRVVLPKLELIRAIQGFRPTSDAHYAQICAQNFFILYRQAPQPDKLKLEQIWNEADLGPFPSESP